MIQSRKLINMKLAWSYVLRLPPAVSRFGQILILN